MNIVDIIKIAEKYQRLPNKAKVAMGIIVVAIIVLCCFYDMFKSYLKEKQLQKKHEIKMKEMNEKHKMDIEKINHKYKKDKEKQMEKEARKMAKNENAQKNEGTQENIDFSETLTFDEIKESSTSQDVDEYLVGHFFPKRGITLFAGEKGLGKTGWLMNAMFKVAGVEGCEILPNVTCSSLPQFVLYYDYELTKPQFVKRYKNLKTNNKFKWCHPQYFTYDYLLKQIKYDLDKIHDNDVTIVVDNVTKIDGMSYDSIANVFYHELESIRDDYFKRGIAITFILVTHVELKRKAYHAVSKSDIKGASKFINFADSVILIGKSCFENSILVKIENNRNGYESNGKAYLFNRSGEPYLHYKYCGEFDEMDLLPKKNNRIFSLSMLDQFTNYDKKEDTSFATKDVRKKKVKIRKEDCLAMLQERSKGKSKNQVASDFGVTRQAYNKALKRYGLVDNYPDGNWKP